jgi:hypothetical protein
MNRIKVYVVEQYHDPSVAVYDNLDAARQHVARFPRADLTITEYELLDTVPDTVKSTSQKEAG